MMEIQEKLHKELQATAFAIFKEWLINAQRDLPNYKFEIIDENKIYEDFTDSVQSAIESLMKRSEAKRSLYNYDYGFFIGFLQGNLNARWFNQYISIQSPESKAVKMNKAILSFFELKMEEAKIVNNFYKDSLLEESNLKEIDSNFDIESLEEYGIEIEEQESDLEIYSFLENEINKNLHIILKNDHKKYVEDLDEFIGEEKAEQWIKYIPVKEDKNDKKDKN